jgi:hypothetical protein
MPIFVLLPQNPDAQAKLPAAVARAYPDANKALANHNWLVAGKGTAQDVSANLGITSKDNSGPGPVGTTIVFEVASYYGRATTDIWDWVKAKWEATGG